MQSRMGPYVIITCSCSPRINTMIYVSYRDTYS